MLATALALSLATPFLASAGAGEPAIHDPLAALARDLDATAAEVLAAFPAYDAARIASATAALEARAGTPAAGPMDGYVLAQGYLELAVIRRFYETEAPGTMPESLGRYEPDALSEAGLGHARAFAASHAGHSDIARVEGELISLQIRGMTGGMTKGPKARAAIERALEADPGNGWARFAVARMHFHNPPFAGGDLDLALAELREIARGVPSFRVSLYIARCYMRKRMDPQAAYWLEKAREQAPGNPEVERLRAGMRTREGDRP